MPRGVKKAPAAIDDQVAEIQSKIQSYQAKIAELNTKKKSLLSSKEKTEMDALYHLVKESGKTPAELISKLAK